MIPAEGDPSQFSIQIGCQLPSAWNLRCRPSKVAGSRLAAGGARGNRSAEYTRSRSSPNAYRSCADDHRGSHPGLRAQARPILHPPPSGRRYVFAARRSTCHPPTPSPALHHPTKTFDPFGSGSLTRMGTSTRCRTFGHKIRESPASISSRRRSRLWIVRWCVETMFPDAVRQRRQDGYVSLDS